MSKRTKSRAKIPVKPAATAPKAPWGLVVLAGAVVLAGIVAAIRYWPLSYSVDSPRTPGGNAVLVLPTEPAPMSVEEIQAESEQNVSRLLEQFPESPAAHKAAAILFQFLNQYDRVTEHWQQAIALDPRDPVPRLALARVQMKQGDDETALRTLGDALVAGLETAEMQHEYAAALQRMNKLAEAEQAAGQALKRYPRDRDLWVVLGQTQVQLGQLAEARGSFDKALAIDPNHVAAHFAAFNVCERLGDKAAADAHRLVVERSRAAKEKEQVPFEVDHERSLRITAATVLSAAATVYDEHGQSQEAERLCRRAYEICPDSPDPHRQLANMYHRDGRLNDGLVVQRRLMEVEPDNAANYLNFASLAQRVGRASEAEATLLQTARTRPDNAAVRHVLARLYMSTAQFDKARSYADEASRLDPSPEAHRFVAEICQRQGDFDGAAAALRAAQALEASGQ